MLSFIKLTVWTVCNVFLERLWNLSSFTKAGECNFLRSLVSWNLTVMVILLHKESKLLLVCWQLLDAWFLCFTHVRKWHHKDQQLEFECRTIQLRDGFLTAGGLNWKQISKASGKFWCLQEQISYRRKKRHLSNYIWHKITGWTPMFSQYKIKLNHYKCLFWPGICTNSQLLLILPASRDSSKSLLET